MASTLCILLSQDQEKISSLQDNGLLSCVNKLN